MVQLEFAQFWIEQLQLKLGIPKMSTDSGIAWLACSIPELCQAQS